MPIHYVMLARNTGLFSNINGVLNRLHHTNEDDAFSVQWNVRMLKMSENNEGRQDRVLKSFAQQTSFPYGTEADG